MGRILGESDSADTSFNNTYVYDAFGQLIRENNKSLDKTFIYEYNEIGNIIAAKTYAYTTGDIGNLTPESTDTYSYDTTHKDRLSAFNGSPISYNTTGCPSSYQGVAWSWKNGRLDTISNGAFANGKSYSFTYDGYGRLKQKQYNYFPGLGVLKDYLSKKTTTYTYDTNGRLVYEYKLLQYSDNTSTYRKFTYLYDESGIVGVVYNNNGEEQTYHYNKNIKGDVIGIFDVNGAEIVKYSYDSWGNFEIATGSLTNIAKDNPILYRGYYYDHDTELYLLDARFYNPKWRRFISPDDTAYLDPKTPNGLNLYAYCNNDPVNYSDPSGNSVIASILIGFAISSLVGWGLSEMFGSQIAGGIGSVGGGAAAISTGINLCAFGPWGIVAGVVLIAVGGLTIAFGANEIVDGATGTNYIQDWTGWSDSVYNGVYTGLNIASAVGAISGNIGMCFASNKILNAIVQDPSKITNYKLWQIKTYGKYTSLYTPGTLKRGSHVGQGYTLTHNRNTSLGYIQWHPGGGHHGHLAYWKITSSFNKAARFYYLTGLPF